MQVVRSYVRFFLLAFFNFRLICAKCFAPMSTWLKTYLRISPFLARDNALQFILITSLSVYRSSSLLYRLSTFDLTDLNRAHTAAQIQKEQGIMVSQSAVLKGTYHQRMPAHPRVPQSDSSQPDNPYKSP
jgi:hypothetical protein